MIILYMKGLYTGGVYFLFIVVATNSTREGCTPSIHSSGHKQYNRVATHYGKVVTYSAPHSRLNSRSSSDSRKARTATPTIS